MSLFNKKIKLIIGVSLAGLLMSLQFLIYISQYCYCEPASPQLEISSISDCNHEVCCMSDHIIADKISGKLKISSQECISYFVNQILFTQQKNNYYQKHTLYYFSFLSDYLSQTNKLQINSHQDDFFLPHNRFIDIINRVQLLI